VGWSLGGLATSAAIQVPPAGESRGRSGRWGAPYAYIASVRPAFSPSTTPQKLEKCVLVLPLHCWRAPGMCRRATLGLPVGADCSRRAPMITPASLPLPLSCALVGSPSFISKACEFVMDTATQKEFQLCLRRSILPWYSRRLVPQTANRRICTRLTAFPPISSPNTSPAIFPSLCLSSQQPPTQRPLSHYNNPSSTTPLPLLPPN
jgi:hypothetical protein